MQSFVLDETRNATGNEKSINNERRKWRLLDGIEGKQEEYFELLFVEFFGEICVFSKYKIFSEKKSRRKFVNILTESNDQNSS